MSSLYNLEPPPTAKVLLNTTAGDLVLELFAKQAPLASRNFLQHCLDGYYDGTIFHRLVPGFIIQGGDPSGLGTGGVSAINEGAPFEDEFHSRLKFNRRGLLGMANSGEPNDNTSQFFLTLDQTPELQGKNTMFGRIEGDTIYNLMKMAEADLAQDGGDRPLYPTQITSTEVLLNPFEDMVKRMHIAQPTKQDAPKPLKKKRKPAKTLLSFGADEADEATPPLPKKAKVNPNFVAPPTVPEVTIKAKLDPKPADPSPTPELLRPEHSPEPEAAPSPDPRPLPTEPAPKPASRPSAPPPQEKEISKLDKVNQQIAELKASMKRSNAPVQPAKEENKSALEAMIPATSTRGRKRGKMTDEKGAMNLFNSFRKKLEHIPQPSSDALPPGSVDDAGRHVDHELKEPPITSAMDTEEKLCDLHFIANCQSCTAWDKDGNPADDDDDDNGTEWMAHALSFAKDTLGKDLEWRRKMEEFEVIDPRAKAKDMQQDGKRDKRDKTRGGREWDKQRDQDKSRSKTTS